MSKLRVIEVNVSRRCPKSGKLLFRFKNRYASGRHTRRAWREKYAREAAWAKEIDDAMRCYTQERETGIPCEACLDRVWEALDLDTWPVEPVTLT